MPFKILLTVGLLLSPALSAADVPKPQTPEEKYKALVAAHEKGVKEFSKAYQAAKTPEERKNISKELVRRTTADTYADDFLKLIQEHPKDPAALDSFRWLMSSLPSREQSQSAMKIILEHWIESPRLESLCQSHSVQGASQTAEHFLRTVLAKSPHTAVKAHACYSLALTQLSELDHRPGYPEEDTEPYRAEAERLLQRIVDEYGSINEFLALGEQAKSHLFEMRNLAIGKTPPDIVGQDLDGKPLKLSDYRGKVVLIAFWGSWCGFCLSDAPGEKALLERFEKQGFAIVGVNNDDNPEKAIEAGKKAGITWRSFQDGKQAPITKMWNVHAWPMLYLLDGKGVIRYKGDYLRSVSARNGPDGKPVQYSFLDEAVERLIKETAEKSSEKK